MSGDILKEEGSTCSATTVDVGLVETLFVTLGLVTKEIGSEVLLEGGSLSWGKWRVVVGYWRGESTFLCASCIPGVDLLVD